MPAPDAPRNAAAVDAGELEIEVVAWITKFVGGDGSTRKVFHLPLRADDTVRKVLRRLSGRFPQLHKALWDPVTGDLAEHMSKCSSTMPSSTSPTAWTALLHRPTGSPSSGSTWGDETV